jgi:DNA-binding transcriptional LysR family regulator
MELRELTVFVKVVQAGSFTAAAELLDGHKAAVSRTIGALERKLGVRLLERSTRSLRLTEVGREVFERAISILGAVEDTERMAQQLFAEPRGLLRLTCGVEFGMLVVSDWINAYLQRYPDVSVEADFTGRIVDLVHEGFDVAIRLGPLADSGLTARRLGQLHYGLFASPGYLLRRGTPSDPAALKEHDWLSFTAARRHRRITLRHRDAAVSFEPRPRLGINNSFAVRDAARAGFGIAQLPLLVATPAVENGSLVRILPDWAAPPVEVHAVYASSRYLSAKVRAFIDGAIARFGSVSQPDTIA